MPQPRQVDEVLDAAIERGDVPGVVVMAAMREGPVYQGAFGKRAVSEGAQMTGDTVFWIASTTKAITSTVATQLVEEGKLALDRSIAEVLPELTSPQVLEGFDAAGRPRLRPAPRPITRRHSQGCEGRRFMGPAFNPGGNPRLEGNAIEISRRNILAFTALGLVVGPAGLASAAGPAGQLT